MSLSLPWDTTDCAKKVGCANKTHRSHIINTDRFIDDDGGNMYVSSLAPSLKSFGKVSVGLHDSRFPASSLISSRVCRKRDEGCRGHILRLLLLWHRTWYLLCVWQLLILLETRESHLHLRFINKPVSSSSSRGTQTASNRGTQ